MITFYYHELETTFNSFVDDDPMTTNDLSFAAYATRVIELANHGKRWQPFDKMVAQHVMTEKLSLDWTR